LPLLPLYTLTQSGQIGASTAYLFAIASFMFAHSKRRLACLMLTPAVLFVGLSVFVNYFATRDDLRQMAWYGQSNIEDRLQRVVDMFQNFKWLDFSDDRHRTAIDGRLNQNYLVGARDRDVSWWAAAFLKELAAQESGSPRHIQLTQPR
jgi:hypothetical protein